jgi:hypothetical protein
VAARTFAVTAEAVAQGQAIGLGMHAEARIARMAKRSARITHADGNRRFDDYVLMIDGSTVSKITRMQKTKPQLSASENIEARRLRVQQAIALHFPSTSATT